MVRSRVLISALIAGLGLSLAGCEPTRSAIARRLRRAFYAGGYYGAPYYGGGYYGGGYDYGGGYGYRTGYYGGGVYRGGVYRGGVYRRAGYGGGGFLPRRGYHGGYHGGYRGGGFHGGGTPTLGRATTPSHRRRSAGAPAFPSSTGILAKGSAGGLD